MKSMAINAPETPHSPTVTMKTLYCLTSASMIWLRLTTLPREDTVLVLRSIW